MQLYIASWKTMWLDRHFFLWLVSSTFCISIVHVHIYSYTPYTSIALASLEQARLIPNCDPSSFFPSFSTCSEGWPHSMNNYYLCNFFLSLLAFSIQLFLISTSTPSSSVLIWSPLVLSSSPWLQLQEIKEKWAPPYLFWSLFSSHTDQSSLLLLLSYMYRWSCGLD